MRSMDMLDCIEVLNQASLFELFRIRSAINRMLDDPTRLSHIRKQLRENQTITYFNSESNQDIKATILTIKRSRVSVKNHHDGAHWTLPLYMINMSGLPTEIKNTTRQIDRLTLKIGDPVGYISRDGIEIYGVVTKRNPKTASITIASGAKWRVPYTMLFPIMDSTRGATELIYDSV
jgi:hypothetical protein